MDLGLKDKVAIVTGAGSQKGYGKGTALALAREGCDIIVADIDIEGAEKTAEEIKNLGRVAIPVKVDITNKDHVQEMVKTSLERFGRIDILVNNAGAGADPKPFIEKTEEEWDKELDLNLRGVLLCTKAVLPQMIERKQGKIVNISSIAAKLPSPQASIYAAAKTGVVGFTRALAVEVIGSGINVNSIAPGLGRTNFVNNVPPSIGGPGTIGPPDITLTEPPTPPPDKTSPLHQLRKISVRVDEIETIEPTPRQEK